MSIISPLHYFSANTVHKTHGRLSLFRFHRLTAFMAVREHANSARTNVSLFWHGTGKSNHHNPRNHGGHAGTKL